MATYYTSARFNFFCQNLLFLNNVNQPNRRVSTSYKPCLLNRYQLLVMFLGWNNDPLFQHPPIKDDCHRTNASMDRINQILSSGHGTHYGKLNICRVPNCLPWAKTRAHGKGPFSHVPQMKLTANNRHTVKDFFAVCSRTRHTANNNMAKFFKP